MRFLNAGDTTLVVEFGNAIDSALVAEVNQLRSHVQRLIASGNMPGVEETIPTFRSLAIIIDPALTSVEQVSKTLQEHPAVAETENAKQSKNWRLPVCYGDKFGPDLESVAKSTELTCAEVVNLHANTQYRVYLLGFQPGYGFLGDTHSKLHLPRLSEPRVKVPAGSVAIAMKLTCVYPWDSPGGWHLLGRCPVPMFNSAGERPTLLSPNDTVTFEPVDATDFKRLHSDVQNNTLSWCDWLESGN